MSCETRSGCEGCPLINLCFPQPENKLLDSGLNSDTISSMSTQESAPVDAFLQQEDLQSNVEQHNKSELELDLSSQLTAEANAVLERQGGLPAHAERHGGVPEDCPFLSSMGAVGIKLYEQFKAAERAPADLPTKSLAEQLAEKRAKKQAEAIAEKTTETPNLTDVTEQKPKLESNPEPNFIQEPTIQDVILEQEIRSQVESDVPRQETVVKIEDPEVAEQPPVVTRKVVVEEPVDKLEPSVHKQPVAELQTEIPAQKLNADKPKAIEFSEVVEAVSLQQEQAPIASSEASIVVQHEQRIELPKPEDVQVGMANETFAEQDQSVEPLIDEPAILSTLTESSSAKSLFVVAEGHQPVAEVETAIEQPRVAEILEELSETYVQLVAEAQALSVDAEDILQKLEPLCEELLMLMDLPSEQTDVKALIHAIVNSALANENAENFVEDLSAEELNTRGTHEYKNSVSATVQNHFASTIKLRVKRFREMSRYILGRIGSPAFAVNT